MNYNPYLYENLAIIVVSVLVTIYGFRLQSLARGIVREVVFTECTNSILQVIQKYTEEAKDVRLSASEQERRWSMASGARQAHQALLDLEQKRQKH